jgi:hypothetical protein
MAKRTPQIVSVEHFYAEGNSGGDLIEIEKMADGVVRLQVGHQCVYSIYQKVVPVEFMTVAITKAIDDYGGPEGVLKASGWSGDFVKKLLAKIQ